VKEMDKDEVKEAIEQIAIRCAQAIMSGMVFMLLNSI
jgi:hypothetical protein